MVRGAEEIIPGRAAKEYYNRLRALITFSALLQEGGESTPSLTSE